MAKQDTPQVGNAQKLVVMGCRLPHGIHMDLDGDGRRITLRGSVSTDITRIDGSRIRGNCGYTPGVPEDFADEWLRRYKDTAMVKKGLIFKQSTLRNAKAQGDEMADEKTGLEPLTTKDLMRGIKPADKKEPSDGDETDGGEDGSDGDPTGAE
jgi:hypothetical protein